MHWENLSDIHIGNTNFQDELFTRRVKDILNEVAGNEKLKIKKFVRFKVGEGI